MNQGSAMASRTATCFTDPGTLTGLWAGLSLAGAMVSLLIVRAALGC